MQQQLHQIQVWPVLVVLCLELFTGFGFAHWVLLLVSHQYGNHQGERFDVPEPARYHAYIQTRTLSQNNVSVGTQDTALPWEPQWLCPL